MEGTERSFSQWKLINASAKLEMFEYQSFPDVPWPVRRPKCRPAPRHTITRVRAVAMAAASRSWWGCLRARLRACRRSRLRLCFGGASLFYTSLLLRPPSSRSSRSTFRPRGGERLGYGITLLLASQFGAVVMERMPVCEELLWIDISSLPRDIQCARRSVRDEGWW